MKKSYVSVANYKTRFHSYKPSHLDKDGESVPYDRKSRTQPNMTLTVEQILTRYANGGRVPGVTGQYLGETLLPDLRRLDFVDVDDLRMHTEAEIKRLNAQYEHINTTLADRREKSTKKQEDMHTFYKDAIQKLKDKEARLAPLLDEFTKKGA